MRDIRTAIFFAQPRVGRAEIEQQHGFAACGVGKGKQAFRTRIYQNEAHPIIGDLLDEGNGVTRFRQIIASQQERLLGEAPSGVVVLYC